MCNKHTTPEQKEKAAQRRAQFRELCKLVGDMTPEQRAKFAQRAPIMTPEGHVLSGTNQMLVMYQCPDATIVGGFHQWLKVGRCVTKGQAALCIWVPTQKTNGKEEPTPENKEKSAEDKPGFIMGNVFDISQTIACEPKDKANGHTPANSKIPASSWFIFWSEHGEENLSFTSWSSLNAYLHQIASAYPDDRGGYWKTKFKITWQDGQDWEGRLDVNRKDDQDCGLHIREWCEFYGGLLTDAQLPKHIKPDQYKQIVSEGDPQSLIDFLNKYALED